MRGYSCPLLGSTNLLRLIKWWYSNYIIPFSVISYNISLKRNFLVTTVLLPSYMKGRINSLFLLVEIWLLAMFSAVLLGWSLFLWVQRTEVEWLDIATDIQKQKPESIQSLPIQTKIKEFLFNLFYFISAYTAPTPRIQVPKAMGKTKLEYCTITHLLYLTLKAHVMK